MIGSWLSVFLPSRSFADKNSVAFPNKLWKTFARCTLLRGQCQSRWMRKRYKWKGLDSSKCFSLKVGKFTGDRSYVTGFRLSVDLLIDRLSNWSETFSHSWRIFSFLRQRCVVDHLFIQLSPFTLSSQPLWTLPSSTLWEPDSLRIDRLLSQQFQYPQSSQWDVGIITAGCWELFQNQGWEIGAILGCSQLIFSAIQTCT